MPRVAFVILFALAACADPSPDHGGAAADSTPSPMVGALPSLPRVGPVEVDSGPRVKQERSPEGVRLVMDPNPGDQINALQPPVLDAANGKRVRFAGTTITRDSLYFVGDVTAAVPLADLPLEGTLTTSYCRQGENLCRSARRQVQIGR
jgi:hypothetical protein